MSTRVARPFPLARRARRGYRREAVDSFLEDVARASASEPVAMAPYEVQDVRFPTVRWSRGYDMRAVDDRLDELEAELRERHGDDSVSGVRGHLAEPRSHRRLVTGIYLAAGLVVVAVVVVAVLTLT